MSCKKILLIGGSGFIGAHLAKKLAELGFDISIFCKDAGNIKKLHFAKTIKFVEGDVCDYGSVEKNVKGQDAVINLASVVNHGSSFDPYRDLDVNCKGQINVLEARRKINRDSKYIFFGTRSQFGIVKEPYKPVKEDCCQRPISLYGISKQAAEHYCSLYRRTFGLKSIVIRLPQVYGPSLSGEQTHSVLDKFIKSALRNEVFYVNGYGRDIKDLVYIDDIVDLIIRVIESNVEEGIFNAGSNTKVALKEVAGKIVSICKSGKFRLVPFPKEIADFELGSFYFDVSKARKTFGWRPKINLNEGLKRTVEFHKRKIN